MPSRIPPRWRILLFAKFLLLVGIGGALVALAVGQMRQPDWQPARLAFAVVNLLFAWFCVWAARRGAQDVIGGNAVTESGVVPLTSRRWGNSMKTKDGRILEFILWNPWEPLRQGTSYTVTYGKNSTVIIAPPVADA